ncbi:MAG TPA: type II toxin-antitoxin system VapC family toxin [Stellaceae bacterium]|jgi:predicted nucleic acid-binding protein
MSALVVDASVALAWCFEDEASPATDAVLDQVKDEGAIVPSLWHLELGNVLLSAERRGRTIQGGVVARLALMAQLPITIDAETAGRAWREILALARAERLTAYDAAYLELAVRRGLPLATKDEALLGAARRVGVPVLF